MTPSFVVLVAARRAVEGLGPARLGVTVGRRVGPAVVRTRVKRRIREWFRRHARALPEGRDVVVIARPAAACATQAQVDAELGGCLVRLARGGRS
jgi:ribonuclease P protein component